MVRIGLLGGVRAATDDGRPLVVGPAKSQTVLAALALAPGTPLPVSRLVELVWGDAPPRTADKTLQWHVAQLRKALGAGTIARVGAAYRLDVPPDAVDVTRFQRRLRDGDPAGALAEWGGTPLAGLDAPGLAAAAAGLTEQWLGAVEADLEHRVEADPRGAVGPLAELAERHPLREGLCALLMTALYRTGRQADALAAFRRARERLVTELGVEPGPALRELEAHILAQDERLHHPSATAATAEATDTRDTGAVDDLGRPLVSPLVGGLPVPPDRLVGRTDELREVTEALGHSPVVTLVGPGGIGKTRLALAAARTTASEHGRDGWLVELAEITSPADVPRAVADVLADGLRVAQRPGQTLTQSLVAGLRTRRALLVLDNCEHVLDGAAALARAVAEGCPEVRVLATARERLAVPGEQVLPVGPLAPAAAVELFHTRALAADPDYDPREHGCHVEEICRRLDGIPLAVELAAARMASHRPVDLAARLDDALRMAGARRTGAARHRTLRAAVRWSYDLLTPAEQALFAQLSVFAAPFELGAARAVAAGRSADGEEADDLLGSLVERSTVAVAFGPTGRRFRLLEPVRQFAAEQLREHGQTDAIAERQARWCLVEVARVHRLLTGPDESEGVARLGELWAHLRSAVAWACAAADPHLADALARPVVTELPLRGRQEIGAWAERILAATAPDDRDLRAFWLVWAAERHTQNANPAAYHRVAERYAVPEHPLARYALAYASGDGEALRRVLPEAVADLRRRSDDHLASFLELTSAGPLLGIGRFEQVDVSVADLADRYRTGGPPTLLHWALQTLGYSASFQGRRDDADRYFDEAALVDVPAGTLSADELTRARSAFRRGDRGRAFRLLRSYVDQLIETDNVVAASVAGIEFVTMMAATGRTAEAAHIRAYLAAANEFGALAARTLVPDLADAAPAAVRIDDRTALTYMRDALSAASRSSPAG
ncbi:BTAD domain-containing putative transcriptional regulator [Kitasatospora sp. NPDC051914]|uniref:BTAD domain-containing putative transcriptional regulator n=1 Tax=Kitasatospora sp. NPDC051914 TaxID=3154945 RepID=UPI0034213705